MLKEERLKAAFAQEKSIPCLLSACSNPWHFKPFDRPVLRRSTPNPTQATWGLVPRKGPLACSVRSTKKADIRLGLFYRVRVEFAGPLSLTLAYGGNISRGGVGRAEFGEEIRSPSAADKRRDGRSAGVFVLWVPFKSVVANHIFQVNLTGMADTADSIQ